MHFKSPVLVVPPLAGEGEGCTPNPFQPITITYKVAVSVPAEWADTLMGSAYSKFLFKWGMYLSKIYSHDELL
jgi:hypothetical protein